MSSRKRIVFRADGNADIGLGHLFRVTTLAQCFAAHGWTWSLATCSTLPDRILRTLGIDRRNITILPQSTNSDAEVLGELIGDVDIMVVDHYHADHAFTEKCKTWAKLVVVIDDLANRELNADILLNQNPGFKDADYDHLTKKDCRLLLGPHYALLRTAFLDGRPNALKARKARRGHLKNLLISLGATDPSGETLESLKALRTSNLDIRITVVLSSAAEGLNSVKTFVDGMQNVDLHIDSGSMVTLMTDADICIGAGGTTSFERCCLGLPTVLIETAANQRRTINALTAEGAAVSAADGTAAANVICELFDTPETVIRMSEAAARICDGQGTKRVVEAVLQARKIPVE